MMAVAPASAHFWQCVTFARSVSGIDIHGNANTWWGQAAGKYERGHQPKVGAVLAFQSTRRMRVGHVAMVSKIVSDREVLLTHANWSRRGGVETNVRAVDVSAAGDWSQVKVWYAPQGGLGTSTYPTNGFIYSGKAPLIEKVTGFRLVTLMAEQTTFVMVPPLLLIFLVLGTIFIGVATPTEGGAMGAVGALILGGMKRRLSFDLIRQAVESTAKLSAFVVFILLGARVFSLTFYGVSGHIWVEHMLTSLPGGQIGFLIFVNAFVFVLAFFLDFFELAFIIIPLLGPAAEKLGIDLIWFGVILGVNMQTSFMHPPFGFALFYLRSVAPREAYNDRVTGKRTDGITTGQIYWGAMPFVVIQVIMVVLVILFPAMVMHYKGVGTGVDPNKVKIDIPQIDMPSLDLSQPPQFK